MLGRMNVRSTLLLGAVAALSLLTFAACGTGEPTTPAHAPANQPPQIMILVPTSTAAPTAAPTPIPTPTPSPLEEGFLLITDVEDATSVQQVSLDGHVFELEIAATSEERARGLMHRESLPQDAGMLFVFSQESTLNFWMKNTLIPLDILYIDSMGVVVDIQTMETQIGAPTSELRTYPSAAPAQYALEINAGLAAALGFEVEDQALFR